MKKNYTTGLVSLILIFLFHFTSDAQAFRKGSLLISISEGSTLANYTTKDIGPKTQGMVRSECIGGTRDPLIIEYGLSKRWSIGLTSGADLFVVKPSQFYGFTNSEDKVNITTGEFTVDCGYHVFVNKRLDLSVSASAGVFATTFKETDNDMTYKYTANGTILRIGTRVRYYIYKRFGVFGMISSYVADSSPKDVKGNTAANNYSTSINGMAIEGGLCFKILK